MDKIKILIVSFSFFPRISPRAHRTTELAIELAKKGHNVKVVTNARDYNYIDFEEKNNLVVEDFVQGKWKDIKGNNIFYRLIRFILNYFFLFPEIQIVHLLKNYFKKEDTYDLIISIAVPHQVHWGLILAMKKNKKLGKVWIADCGDPFLGNKESTFKMPFYFRWVENWFCKKPDYITVPISKAKNAYPKSCQNKIKVIPQGFNFEINKTITVNKKNANPVFAYCGTLTELRNPTQFLEFLSKLEKEKFTFIIYTKSINILEPFRKKLGDKLVVKDYIPREQLINELMEMDFLVNFENINSVQSPSKLIDYAITNKPILSINPLKLNSEIVLQFLNGNYNNKLIIENIEEFNIKNVAEKFIKLYELKYK